MKRFIMITVVLVIGITVSAQRMLPRQKGIELNSGIFLSGNPDTYVINAGLIVHFKKGNYMLYAVEYSREIIPYRNYQIPAETYFAEAGYSFNLIPNHKKSVMVNAMISAVGGYEMVNHSESLLYDGAVLINKSSFVYGAGGRLSLETYLSDRFVLIASASTKTLWKTSRYQFRPSIGIGLRINL